jgi:hypothetical protein
MLERERGGYYETNEKGLSERRRERKKERKGRRSDPISKQPPNPTSNQRDQK